MPSRLYAISSRICFCFYSILNEGYINANENIYMKTAAGKKSFSSYVRRVCVCTGATVTQIRVLV